MIKKTKKEAMEEIKEMIKNANVIISDKKIYVNGTALDLLASLGIFANHLNTDCDIPKGAIKEVINFALENDDTNDDTDDDIEEEDDLDIDSPLIPESLKKDIRDLFKSIKELIEDEDKDE